MSIQAGRGSVVAMLDSHKGHVPDLHMAIFLTRTKQKIQKIVQQRTPTFSFDSDTYLLL